MTKTKDWFKKVLNVNKTVSSGNKVKQEPEPILTPISDIENILNKALAGDYSELDYIIMSSQKNDKNLFVILNPENFKNFCSQWLKLEIESRSDHQYIYSNILSHYNRNEQFEYKYYRSELLLLAIAANDQLAERYHKELYAEKNLSLLPLLVGRKWYVSEFIERFPELYQEQKLKEKKILSNEQTIGFFSVIAANKYQELLEAVLTPYALDDLKLELQKAQEDPMYGVLEVAALMVNQVFIEKVLEFIERGYSSENDLLKSSFITLLTTTISQESTSIVEYLCEKCTKNKDTAIQEIYKTALSDDKIIEKINKQILGNIHRAEGKRQQKQQKIYETILKTALRVGNMELVTTLLNEIENKSQLLADYEIEIKPQLFITKNLLRDSLNDILEYDEGVHLIAKRMFAKMNGDVKKIYTEVYNNRKALDLRQKATGSHSPEENIMTNDNEIANPTTNTESNSRRSSTVSIPEDWFSKDDKYDNGIYSGVDSEKSATASKQSLSRVYGSTGSDISLSKVPTDYESQDKQTETPGHKFHIANSLYAKLQAKNEKGEYYDSAESGATARGDLSRDGIIINGVKIPAGNIKKQFNKAKQLQSENDDRKVAKSVFTQAFEYVRNTIPETEIPNDSIIQELITNYNQSGHWVFIFAQVMSILSKTDLMLFERVHKSSINCTDSNCVSIKFDYLTYIAYFDDGDKKLCELNCTLEFKLKNVDDKLVYEDATISLDASKELEVRYVEVPRDKPEADAPEGPKVVSLIPEIRKYLSSGVLPELFTSNEPVDVLHNGEVVFSYDKDSNQMSKRSTIKNENKVTIGQYSQSKSKKTYRDELFTTAIATFTIALTATAAASVFTAIYHETMPIKLVEAVGTYSLVIALIAACCLAVTAIIYCCTNPANLLENNNIEKQVNNVQAGARS